MSVKLYHVYIFLHLSPGASGTLSSSQSISQQILQRCNFLFSQALDADERDHKDIAVELYSQTAEYALTHVRYIIYLKQYVFVFLHRINLFSNH